MNLAAPAKNIVTKHERGYKTMPKSCSENIRLLIISVIER